MNVIVDGYYNAVSGSPDFFSYIGSKNLTSFLKNAYTDDIPRIREIFETLKFGESSYLAFRLKCCKQSFEWVFMEAKLLANDDNNNIETKRIYTEIHIIKDFKSAIIKNDSAVKEYRTLLGILEEIYFEYSFESQNIRFYWINKNQDINIYNDKFSEWKKYMTENNYIKKKNISIFEKFCRDIQNGSRKFAYEISDSIVYADDEFIYNTFKGATIFFDGKPCKVIGTLTPDRRIYENGIVKTSIDSLTGLLSKEAIEKYANELINKMPNYFINIVIIDIDNFKLINDTFGHLFGDDIIKEIADTIDDVVKERGVVGRFGGDEFVIVFSEFNDNMELRSYLKSIRMTVESKFKGVGGRIDLTVSIGTAKYPTDGHTYDDLFRKADTCLYIAKEKGKNRYIICDEIAYIASYEKKEKQNIISIESREKMAEFMCGNMNILINKKRDGIQDVIKAFAGNRNLSRVAVFFGKGLKRVSVWGDCNNLYDNAMYIYKGNYLTNFNSNGVFVVRSSAMIEGKNPDVHFDFLNQSIYSVIQCLIYDNDKEIIGLVCFEKNFERKGWTENEVYNFTLITYMIGEILKKY